ncbi:MAG: DUF4013 domain-containing protein [Anaerolineales bacterium]|nr:DUF4013 domain-containing protein [Anaerolineales bacterium]
MLLGFSLNDLFLFPLQDREARKHLLIGSLIYLAGFIIPILPILVITGYHAIIVRQILNGEKPHLVKWDNWDALLKDGLRMMGIRLVFALPIFVLMFPFFISMFALPFIASLGKGNENIIFIFILISILVFILITPLSLIIGIIAPVSEIHMLAKDEFTAGFKVSAWWPIFKANWGGFVLAYAIVYGATMVLMFAMQFLFVTVVLICLVPFLLAGISMYYTLIMYVTFAQAYKQGLEKIYPSKGIVVNEGGTS